MKITSPDFKDNGQIPKRFTCEGDNINPNLKFEEIGSSTKSLALIVDDPDAPFGTFTHWLMWNIEPSVSGIGAGAPPDGTAIQGVTSFGKAQYGGPCPPPGNPHRYIFKLYALDSMLDLKAGADKHQLENAIKPHLLGVAQLTGLYQR
ncbi:MAG TPA: YbhB/YbcL family Raf kinase inhibitor-like protein [Candidatus Paceibacterota bacterium]|nr:YbhB/YbcL family Raf kinase inhibitor-like protein [Candidatus Paceibacterota bacterium]